MICLSWSLTTVTEKTIVSSTATSEPHEVKWIFFSNEVSNKTFNSPASNWDEGRNLTKPEWIRQTVFT